jgi:hypothetical protein
MKLDKKYVKEMESLPLDDINEVNKQMNLEN